MCASEQERLHTPYLHHSLALLAAEVGQVKEARQWFQSGTMTLQVRLMLPAVHRPDLIYSCREPVPGLSLKCPHASGYMCCYIAG